MWRSDANFHCHRCTHVSLYSACYLHWIKLAAWSYRLGYLLRTIYPDGKEINDGDICFIYHFIILPPPPICWIVMSILYVFILVASSHMVVWYLQTFCLSFATSHKTQCVIFYWADLTFILNFIFCSMQKTKYVFYLFFFNENTIKTFRLRHGQKVEISPKPKRIVRLNAHKC